MLQNTIESKGVYPGFKM